jgi:hypothetical protein
MLFREVIKIYSENHMKHITYSLWEKLRDSLMLKRTVYIITIVL